MNLSPSEADFWKRVYEAAVKSGVNNPVLAADTAVQQLRQRTQRQ